MTPDMLRFYTSTLSGRTEADNITLKELQGAGPTVTDSVRALIEQAYRQVAPGDTDTDTEE